jgi:hypothetical protein
MSIKKRGMPIIMTVIVLCLVPNSSQADVKLSFKIHGGWSYLQAGDVNPGTQAFLDWGTSHYEITEGEYRALHQGYEVGGDLIFELGRNFGVGVGAGFMRFSKRNQANGWEPDYGPTVLFTSDSELTAIPTRLFVLFSTPLNRKIDIIANAGISYFFNARYYADWQEFYSVAASVEYWMNILIKAEMKRDPFGFQGGMGIEYRLTPSYTLFSEESKLYFETFPLLADAPRLIMVQSAPPLGPEGEAREAVVDFSGFSLQAGFRFYF